MSGEPLSKFVFKVFSEKHPEDMQSVIEDLMPTFQNTIRKIKMNDGAEFVNKNLKVNLEDYEGIANNMYKECEQMKAVLTEVVKERHDMADAFKLQMPKMFAKAEEMVHSFVHMRDRLKDKYQQTLKLLNMDEKTKPKDFSVMWDNLFVPEVMMLKAAA